MAEKEEGYEIMSTDDSRICKHCHRAHDARWNPRHMFEPTGEPAPSPVAARMETPEEMAADAWGLPSVAQREWFAAGVAADRSHLCSLLDGIRAKHSPRGTLDAEAYAAEVMGLVARMGREGT